MMGRTKSASPSVPLLAMVVATIAMLIISPVVYAATHFGRNKHYGYYRNLYANSGDYVSRTGIELGGGNDYSGSLTRKDKLISLLNSWKDTPTTSEDWIQRRVGASFIIDTMLGRNAAGSGYTDAKSSTAMDADITVLDTRLDAFIKDGGRIVLKNTPYTVNTYYQTSRGDVAWYAESDTQSAYVFTKGGVNYYELKKICANPLGDLSGIPVPPAPPKPVTWSVSGASYISKNAKSITGTSPITASVGEPIYWKHTLTNNGPDNMDRNVSYQVIRTTNGTSSTVVSKGTTTERRKTTILTKTDNLTLNTSHEGKTICEYIKWWPQSSTNSASKTSTARCVSVFYSGFVYGKLTVTPESTSVDDGMTVRAVYSGVNDTNAAAKVSYEGHLWYDKNNNGKLDSSDTDLFGKTGTYTLPQKKTTDITSAEEQANIAKGGRICASWILTSADPLVRTRTPNPPIIECRYIGSTPRVEAWGNDIRVGGSLDGSANVASIIRGRLQVANGGADYRGSWSEYGLLAPVGASRKSSILNIASAAGLAEALTPRSKNQSSWSKLTFANTFSASTCQFGCFTAKEGMGTIPEIENYLVRHGITANVTRTTGAHTISSNITNSGNTTQRIIIADDIKIHSNVTQIDAWLIARNTLDTCANASGALTIDKCTAPLVVNGPIFAKTLLLRRVGPLLTDKAAAAERVSLRGDAYIWAYRQTHPANTPYMTKAITELPPRY